MSEKINPIRRINWFFMKRFGFGFKQNYPFRTSTIFAKKHFKGKSIVAIEVGTHRGDSAEYLFNKIPNVKKLFCVDPYDEKYIIDGKSAPFHLKKAKKRLSKFSKRCKFIVKTSDNAAKDFSKDSVDYIYIDGLHTYEQVKKDMKNYFPFLRKGGIMAGHDIERPEIAKAFFEFCREKKQDPIMKDMDWILVKK